MPLLTGRSNSLDVNIYFFTTVGHYVGSFYADLGSLHHDVRATFVFQPETSSRP